MIWLDRGRIVGDGASQDVIRAYREATGNAPPASKKRAETGRRTVFLSGAPGARAHSLGHLLNCQPDVMVGVGRYELAQFQSELDSGSDFFSPCRFLAGPAQAETSGPAAAPLTSGRFHQARVVGEVVPRLHRCVSALVRRWPDSPVVFLFSGPLDILRQGQPRQIQFDESAERMLHDWNTALATVDRAKQRGARVLFVSRERLFGMQASRYSVACLASLADRSVARPSHGGICVRPESAGVPTGRSTRLARRWNAKCIATPTSSCSTICWRPACSMSP